MYLVVKLFGKQWLIIYCSLGLASNMLLFNLVSSGFRSVCRVKCLPYRK